MVIDEVEGQSNLNHHKSDEDHVAVPNRLARSGDSAGRVLAEKMRVLRPGLAYEFPNG
jgi:transcriptional regulator